MNTVMTVLMAQPGGQGGGWSSMIMMGLIVLVFYFFMIRPQMKKQKEAKKFMEGIKEGDKVVTIGGIIAKVVKVNEKDFLLEIEGGAKIRVLKSAVSSDNSIGINQTA